MCEGHLQCERYARIVPEASSSQSLATASSDSFVSVSVSLASSTTPLLLRYRPIRDDPEREEPARADTVHGLSGGGPAAGAAAHHRDGDVRAAVADAPDARAAGRAGQPARPDGAAGDDRGIFEPAPVAAADAGRRPECDPGPKSQRVKPSRLFGRLVRGLFGGRKKHRPATASDGVRNEGAVE